jgi:hypothetical protein
VKAHIREAAGNRDLSEVKAAAREAERAFELAVSEIHSILVVESEKIDDVFCRKLTDDLDKIGPLKPINIADHWMPKRKILTGDLEAIGQGSKVPPHIAIRAEVASIRQSFNICGEAALIARQAASHLERRSRRDMRDARIGTNVFIGHGRSQVWRELKDLIEGRLRLPWDEFNRVPIAGMTNQARLSEMLDDAAVALVIMTAEDETADGAMQARMNVIHEVGLFQGRLGFSKAIVLLEEGCQEFSNIEGVGQVRFPRGNIAACFEEVRRLLEREGLLRG